MTSYCAFLHFILLGYALLCLEFCQAKFVDVPKEEITPPPVTASTNGWRPLLPSTEKVSVPAANAQRGGHHRQSVTTITPYVTVHPVLGKLHAHLENAERSKRIHHQPHGTRVEIYSHTPPSILGSFTVFGHATVKSRNINKPPKKSQSLDSETSETRISAAGRLVPPPVPQTLSFSRFPADSAFKFNYDTVDKHRPAYYIPLAQKDAAFQFLSPPKTENKYYYTSVGEYPSHYSNLGATQILSPLSQSQYFPPASISHTSTKFSDGDLVKFLPQSTDIQVSGGESVGTSKPHQVFLSPPRVQDIPQVPVTPSTQQVFGRVQDTPVTPISQQLFPHPGRVQDTPVTPSTQHVFVHSGRIQESSLHSQNSAIGNSQHVYVHPPQVSVSTSSPQQTFVHPERLQDSALYKQEKPTTSVPTQVTFVQQGKVQDVSLHNKQPQLIPDKDVLEFSVYQRKKNKQQYETTAHTPKWSPEDPYRAKLVQQSPSATHLKNDHIEHVGSVLNQLLDGRIPSDSAPLTFEREEIPLTTTPLPQEAPKKVYYPTQQTFAQLPPLRGTAEKLRIARPYFDQDRTIRNEQEEGNAQYEHSEVIPSRSGSPHTSINVNKEPPPTKYPEVRTTRKPLKPLLPTPLTEEEEEVEEAEEQDFTAQGQLEEEQNEIRTHPTRRPSVQTRLPPAELEDDEKIREQRPYRLRRPVTRRPVTDQYEEDSGSRSRTPAISQREPADDSTSTRRERWRTNTNRPERNRNRNRYTERQNDSESLKQKRRRRPSYASEYHEDELTTISADYQFSAVGNEDTTTTSTTTPVYSEYRKPNRGRERHRNRLPPVHRRVVTTSTTPPTAHAEEPSDINWQQDDYVYEHNNHNSQSTSSNIFDEPHTLNEIYEADEFIATKSSTTPTTSTTTTTTTAPTTTTTTTTTTTPEPTTVISITTTPEPTTTSAALRLRNRYRYRANATRPRFSVKDYKERLTKLSSITHSSPGGEPQDEHHNPDLVQINEETRNEEVQESVKTSTDEEHSSSFDIVKTDEATKDVKTEITSSTTAPTRIRQPLRTRGSYFYGSTSSTTTTSTIPPEPSTRSRYRQREHSRYNPSLRSRYSTTSTTTTTTTESSAAVSTSTERLNLFKPAHIRQYRPGLKYSRYRSSTETPTVEEPASPAAADEDSKTRNSPHPATRKPYPYRSRYSARITSSTEKPADTDAANSDVTEMTSSDTLKTPKDTIAPVMSEKIDTTTSESQEVLDGDWSTTLGLLGVSVSTTTSVSDSNSIAESSVTDLPTFAPAYHEDQEDLSQRIADLTSSASSAGYFKTMAPPQRTNLRITMATDDPILPIEAFFPVRSKRGDRR